MILIEILVGLPGSGKTYYAEHQPDKMDHGVRVVDCDQYIRNRTSNKPLGDFYLLDKVDMRNVVYYRTRGWNHWIFDGLFTTNVDQDELVWEFKNLLLKQPGRPTKGEHVTIKFIYFKENRKVCLYNDSFRKKERQAQATIKQLKLERPNIESLKTRYPEFTFELEEKDIHKMNHYETAVKRYESEWHEDELLSEEWSNGGTWEDYKGNSGPIGADPKPVFSEFEKMLEEICPNLTHIQYKKLYDETVTEKEREDYDYYGGCSYYGYYSCDLKKLYAKMKEMNLIKED